MYLSYVLGQSIKDTTGKEYGKLVDLIVSPSTHLPVVSGIVIRVGGENKNIAWKSLAYDEIEERFCINVEIDEITYYEVSDEDFFLKTNLMDKQIMDVHNYRVVRVNDVRTEPSGERLFFVGVDTGVRGLLRRMGLIHAADRISKIFAKIKFLPSVKINSKLIAWHDIEALERGEGRIKLNVSAERLSTLHPSDIARILNELDPNQRTDVMENLDIETAAEVLTEAHPDVQASIVENLEEELAADILEEMEPDEAADILGDVSEEKREDLLEEMEPEEAEDVKELLAYDDECAGGLMTTEYVAVSKDLTAQQTIDMLREMCLDAEMIYYVYVIDTSEHLVGVISLRDLILAKPDTPIEEFMVQKVIHVHLDADIEKIAQTLSDYNLLALPVVDEENRLQGIITIDDALEEIMPEDSKKKMSRRWH